MRTTRLGANGPLVSRMGLGCMRLTPLMPGVGALDEAEAIAAIHAALDAGISLLNTGDFYSMGLNEAVVGKAVRGRRDKAFLSVKCGALRAPSGALLGLDLRPQAIKNFCAYSLQRLGVDVIDLYQPARVDPAVPVEETIGAIADLVAEGKVRHIGVSEYNAEQLRRAAAVHPVAALEIEYSLATRFIESAILPAARALRVGVVAYGVVTQGLLTGAFSAETPISGAHRMMPRFSADNIGRNAAVVEALRALAATKGASPAQVAIAWVMAQGEDVIPLIGVSSRRHLAENIAAGELTLSHDDLRKLDALFAPGAIAGARVPEAHAHMVAC